MLIDSADKFVDLIEAIRLLIANSQDREQPSKDQHMTLASLMGRGWSPNDAVAFVVGGGTLLQ